MAQSRIYGWLLYGPHSIESLASVSFLGNRVVADNVAALVEAGHIERDESGLLHLTQAGRETATIIARRAQRFELDLLKNVDPGEVASARRVLAKLCTAQ